MRREALEGCVEHGCARQHGVTPAPADSGRPPDTSDTADSADTGDSGDSGEQSSPRIAWFDDVGAIDLSPDGNVALVNRLSSLEGELLFIDTGTDTVTTVTTLGDATQNFATGLSNAGRISALRGIPVEAGV